MSDWQGIFERLTEAAALSAPPARVRFNPRPAGSIQKGSATDAVLRFLTERPGVFFTRQQIVERTQCSGKAVDWALIFLRDQALIEAVPDAIRNPRFLRYRAPRKAFPDAPQT